MRRWSVCLLICLIASGLAGPLQAQGQDAPAKTNQKKQGRRVGMELIGEKGLAEWREPLGDWKIAGDVKLDPGDNKKLAVAREGAGTIVNGATGKTRDLISKQEFGDVQAHIEFLIPKGSNSGVYFMGRYEIQIYDTFGLPLGQPYEGCECGGIYHRWIDNKGIEGHSPKVNAARPAGEWQTYDVTFRAPRFDKDGKKIANACFIKVLHNGKVIHENVEVKGATRSSVFTDEAARGPLQLQGDHGPVAYRNIRVRPMRRGVAAE